MSTVGHEYSWGGGGWAVKRMAHPPPEAWDCSGWYGPALAHGTYSLTVLNRWLALLRASRRS